MLMLPRVPLAATILTQPMRECRQRLPPFLTRYRRKSIWPHEQRLLCRQSCRLLCRPPLHLPLNRLTQKGQPRYGLAARVAGLPRRKMRNGHCPGVFGWRHTLIGGLSSCQMAGIS